MNPQPGEVWLADLGLSAKTRPVVIVSRYDSDAPRALIIYVPLTTQNRQSIYEVELPNLSFIDRDSVANVQGIGSIPRVRLERKLGKLPDGLMFKIKSVLSDTLIKEEDKKTHKLSIVIRKNDFDKLRNNRKFHLILRLTRILNSIRFSWSSTVNLKFGETPADSRDRIASFLYMCALHHEIFRNDGIYYNLEKEFLHLPSFRNGLNILNEDISGKKYLKKILRLARNKIAFHFTPDAIKKSIGDMKVKDDEVTFGESHTDRTGDVYFSLSDELVMHYLMDIVELDRQAAERFKVLINDVSNISKKFIEGSEPLIVEALQEMGWEIASK